MRVGMRLSLSGTQRRVSSSVDQITCCRPACFAASAMAAALAISFSGEKCAQKKAYVQDYDPPPNELSHLCEFGWADLSRLDGELQAASGVQAQR